MVAVKTYKKANLSWIKAGNIEKYRLRLERQKNMTKD